MDLTIKASRSGSFEPCDATTACRIVYASRLPHGFNVSERGLRTEIVDISDFDGGSIHLRWELRSSSPREREVKIYAPSSLGSGENDKTYPHHNPLVCGHAAFGGSSVLIADGDACGSFSIERVRIGLGRRILRVESGIRRLARRRRQPAADLIQTGGSSLHLPGDLTMNAVVSPETVMQGIHFKGVVLVLLFFGTQAVLTARNLQRQSRPT